MKIRAGFFPSTTDGLEDLEFAWVHLDADLYESTLDGLRWFGPRTVKGGYILIHDYWALEPVRQAVEDANVGAMGLSPVTMGGTHLGLIKE